MFNLNVIVTKTSVSAKKLFCYRITGKVINHVTFPHKGSLFDMWDYVLYIDNYFRYHDIYMSLDHKKKTGNATKVLLAQQMRPE